MMLGLGETPRRSAAGDGRNCRAGNAHPHAGAIHAARRPEHLPIERYVHPDEFAEFKRLGEQMGFKHVEAGPLVRSSYHAFERFSRRVWRRLVRGGGRGSVAKHEDPVEGVTTSLDV